ncbi:hypothetical protein, unlikely [Trypanosoma brucei gambiense DAL972]|uniref:T. brucei spp.-specific protein n=1 Tax=Trypanosoma brucei gambiense (strain MHOM/CI/86/DAL972) TaxID=679716 RepID=D0A0Y0_TRYB9|nr:hypothetical protein, unlikely [Trypanosoma brucei gambiense DAL972]CBH14922.1 hypothetical protein, unlikely [Trypanosoma brucei gambiense DAL972]|eukprot:XP_011777188.1 hypothetical protein, unlikely [Trypanosoma brucei gambiense DAL972]
MILLSTFVVSVFVYGLSVCGVCDAVNVHPWGRHSIRGTIHIHILRGPRSQFPFFLVCSSSVSRVGIYNNGAVNNSFNKVRSFALSRLLAVLKCTFLHVLTAVMFNTLLSVMKEEQHFLPMNCFLVLSNPLQMQWHHWCFQLPSTRVFTYLQSSGTQCFGEFGQSTIFFMSLDTATLSIIQL